LKRFLFAFLFATTLSQAATINITAPSSVTGSTFDVQVNAKNVFTNFPGEAITGFGFNVTVSSPSVTFTGENVNNTYFDDFTGCCGSTVVGLTSLSYPAGIASTDFTAPLLLATLHFSVNGPGKVTIGVTADNNSDPNQGLIFLSGGESFSASQDVTITATPEPGAILLSVLGLGVLALGKRHLLPR